MKSEDERLESTHNLQGKTPVDRLFSTIGGVSELKPLRSTPVSILASDARNLVDYSV